MLRRSENRRPIESSAAARTWLRPGTGALRGRCPNAPARVAFGTLAQSDPVQPGPSKIGRLGFSPWPGSRGRSPHPGTPARRKYRPSGGQSGSVAPGQTNLRLGARVGHVRTPPPIPNRQERFPVLQGTLHRPENRRPIESSAAARTWLRPGTGALRGRCPNAPARVAFGTLAQSDPVQPGPSKIGRLGFSPWPGSRGRSPHPGTPGMDGQFCLEK
jgi:hypothetical protein